MFLALVALLSSNIASANPQDTVWVAQTNFSSMALIAFSPDSKYIAVGDEYTYIFDAATGQEVKSYPINCNTGVIKWSKSGKYLLFGSKEASEYNLIDATNWQILKTIKIDDEQACFSSDEKYIITANQEEKLKKKFARFQIWEISTGNIIKIIDKTNCPDITSMKIVYAMECSNNPKEIYWVSYQGGLKKINIETNLIDTIYTNATSNLRSFSISSDGNLAAFEPISSNEFVFCIFNLTTKQITFKVAGEHPFGVSNGTSGSSISSDNRYLALSNSYSKKVDIWNIQANKYLYSYTTVPCCYSMYGVSFSNDGKYVVSSSRYLFLYDLSKATSIEETGLNTSMIYPNPGNETANIKFHLELPSVIKINIINSNGEIFPKYNKYHESGNYNITISINDLSSGNYIVQTSIGDKKFTYKLIITK